MHELSVLVEVVRQVKEIMDENDIKKVDTIVMEIGELSSVLPMYMYEYFPVICDDKPEFKDTKLEIITLPGNARCYDCGTIFNVIDNKGYCPKCNSFEKELLCGKECNIKEILVADDEEDEPDENEPDE